jgi:hypothetical protein
MSLIPFPNVPNVLGVPVVKRILSSGGIVNKTISIVGQVSTSAQNLLGAFSAPEWQILNVSNQQAIMPDSVLSVEVKSDSKVVTHPVEMGSFSAYNKKIEPTEARVTMMCTGQSIPYLSASGLFPVRGGMSLDVFLSTLKSMKKSTSLFTITSPDEIYQNMNLKHFDYRREATKNATIIVVECWFMEILQTAIATTTTTAQPSGAEQTDTGTTAATAPTSSQASKGVAT